MCRHSGYIVCCLCPPFDAYPLWLSVITITIEDWRILALHVTVRWGILVNLGKLWLRKRLWKLLCDLAIRNALQQDAWPWNWRISKTPEAFFTMLRAATRISGSAVETHVITISSSAWPAKAPSRALWGPSPQGGWEMTTSSFQELGEVWAEAMKIHSVSRSPTGR